jgi:hypothetical protein
VGVAVSGRVFCFAVLGFELHLVLARQVLYHLSRASSPTCLPRMLQVLNLISNSANIKGRGRRIKIRVVVGVAGKSMEDLIGP